MLLIWSIFSDDPEIMAKVDKFFDQFNNMPFWYQALFIGVVSAIYGLKGADIIKRNNGKGAQVGVNTYVKRTKPSIGRHKKNMNKQEKKSYKKYRGQGR